MFEKYLCNLKQKKNNNIMIYFSFFLSLQAVKVYTERVPSFSFAIYLNLFVWKTSHVVKAISHH